MSPSDPAPASEPAFAEVAVVEPVGRRLHGKVRLPGSKSLTNRALVCASLAPGTSELSGALFADDTLAMVECLGLLGAEIELDATRATMVVHAPDRLGQRSARLNARQSGTTGRFVLPLAALGRASITVDGHAQLRHRPFAPLLRALAELGAEVVALERPDCLPVTLKGPLAGGAVAVGGDVSSQFLSALVLAAPAMGEGLDLRITTELVSASYLTMTLRVMEAFGVRAEVAVDGDGLRKVVVAPSRYRSRSYAIEPDASAASYFLAAAAITRGEIELEGLGTASLQGDVAFVDFLEQMGARIERFSTRTLLRADAPLRGICADLSDCSDLAPTLAVVASFATTPSELHGIGFIRHKESDRIAAIVTELRRAGIAAEDLGDGIKVTPGPARRARLRTYDDHRIAMSLALLGLVGEGIEIENPGCVAKTFPDYFTRLGHLAKSA